MGAAAQSSAGTVTRSAATGQAAPRFAAGKPRAREPCGPSFVPMHLRAPLTAVHAEVAVIFVQGFQRGDIRSPGRNLIHPLDGLHHLVPLLLREDGGALMLGDLLWVRERNPS